MFGPVMLDLQGIELTDVEKELLAHPAVGGVILFSRNFESVEQLCALTYHIQQYSNHSCLIAVDHEGGRVQRFRDGFSPIPAMGAFASLLEHDPNKAVYFTTEMGWLMATEVQACGIDFSFAPVLDVDGESEVIGDRSFSEQPEHIVELSTHFIRGMNEAGMAATGKHFPGHGTVKADSHIAMPVDEREFAEIEAHDLIPFQALIHEEILQGVMPAHVIYSKVDPHPAGFSTYWMQRVLREQLGFEGVIFSDDLTMQGAEVAGDYTQRADAALNAGCDMILVCNNPQAAIQVVDHLPAQSVSKASQARLAAFCASDEVRRRTTWTLHHAWNALKETKRWGRAVQLLERLS